MVSVFVYGTLMQGERAHYMIKGAEFVGKYRLSNFGMYDLGSYPGIKTIKDESVVGEVYNVDEGIIPQLDSYEGEGTLYKRETVKVSNGKDSMYVYAYIYIQSVEGRRLIRQPWNAKQSDYVWYAAYGSNLSRDRFRNYIEGGLYALTGKSCPGCRDKSLWIDECIKTYKGELYYGNESHTWEGKGVAFYDSSKEGLVKMRLYKITREQLDEIHLQEGKSMNWYGKCECLNIIDDCEVYTLTSETRRKVKAPCDKYYNLIMSELGEI